jgi:DNA helicase-2/ATP-dependent DNA helicase PcrA
LLYITHAANRRIYNQWQSCIPSRFLQEIPHNHVEMLDGGVQRASGPAMFQRGIEDIFNEAVRVNPAMSIPSASLWLHKRVFHQKFGYGKVVAEQGNHLEIMFDHSGRKKLMRDYVTLA